MIDRDALLHEMFRGADRIPVPWPPAPRLKSGPRFDDGAIARVLGSVAVLEEIDPFELHASQPWILAEHVAFYLTGEWERTGRTSADRHGAANRFPAVLTDPLGKRIIVAGHHRAAAARLLGRPLLARTRPGGAGATAALTPTLTWPLTRSAEEMRILLAQRGLEVDEIDFALAVARPGHDHHGVHDSGRRVGATSEHRR